MKPEDQIIAIAAACGWHPDPVWASVRTPTHCVFKKGDELRTTKELPDWLNSLDAMAEAEKFLDDLQRESYANFLNDGTYDDFEWLSSSANRRAEAFLRAIGKWRAE